MTPARGADRESAGWSARLFVMKREMVSIMQACEMVGVSRRTIYNWIAAAKVEYVRTAGGSVRIFADTLWRDAEHSVSTQTEVPQGERPRAGTAA